MKLPKMTAEQSLVSPSDQFQGTAQRADAPGVEMMINLGCLLGCGVGLLAHIGCGTNLACWAAAAPDSIACITKCF